MISEKELKAFYKEKLEPQLNSSEESNDSSSNKQTFFKISVAGVVIFFFISVFTSFQIRLTVLLFGLSIFFSIFSILLKKASTPSYKENFKEKVVKSIIKFIDEAWTYSYYDKIRKMDYEKSNLFRDSADVYEGDDFCEGVVGQTRFKSSELHIQNKKVTNTYRSNKNICYDLLFKGFFFQADLSRSYSGSTIIRSKRYREVECFFPVVHVEDSKFSELYVVESNNLVEANAILTPETRRALIKLYYYHNREIDFSFTGKHLYCAVSFNEELFEPSVSGEQTDYDFEYIKKIYSLLYFNKEILQELNLTAEVYADEKDKTITNKNTQNDFQRNTQRFL
ncbi:DUF3137 domain-containing protein [Flammeovirga aprica]|uniref:DUF3137 domain-containing protein n=1 Tax=Flammeovirga aprica JL-4 TaxID=694437 RepID=A0A7X9XCW7_9BACT|nr:DUF3137 domain-containing protein [Flammeovirga aprica]NME72237.1 DUF3137 domain-containing protein [Flammeovirga aprica JL-4]